MSENNQQELRALSEEELTELKRQHGVYKGNKWTLPHTTETIERLLATIDSLRAPEPLGDLEKFCIQLAGKLNIGTIYEGEVVKVLIPELTAYIHQRDKALAKEIRDQEKRKDEEWGNLMALCQVCHLQIQGKVDPETPFFLEHSEWIKPYVAGFYAYKYEDKLLTQEEVAARMDDLLRYELRVDGRNK